jgi:DNA topoisomerase I
MANAALAALPLPELPSPDDPVAAAVAAGLRYVSDDSPGITRTGHGKGFSYRGADGQRIRDAETLARVRALAIPPAWSEVWICPHPRGHLQATGRDQRNRKQYRYHERWREVRDATKFDRMREFGHALPELRAIVRRHLRRRGLPREKVLATVVRLLEATCIRVGNEEYRRSNGTVGLTTLRDHQVRVRGSRLFFRFKAKGGVQRQVTLTDRMLARLVRECQELPGYELFQYLEGGRTPRAVDSADVNDYLREVSGRSFTAKDFRTWMGTVHAVSRLRALCADPAHDPSKKELLAVIDYVAGQLTNTRAVCRKFYVHPGLQTAYLEGRLAAPLAALAEVDPVPGLSRDESLLLGLLERL